MLSVAVVCGLVEPQLPPTCDSKLNVAALAIRGANSPAASTPPAVRRTSRRVGVQMYPFREYPT